MGHRSTELFRQAKEYLAGGVSRNTVLRPPHPFYVQKGSGCRVVDVDGVERIDFANNMASLIHGHAHPEIVAAVTAQLRRGTAYTMATEVEITPSVARVDMVVVYAVKSRRSMTTVLPG